MKAVLLFLSELLTGRLEGFAVKDKALELYVLLKMASKEDYLILSFPFFYSYMLHIKSADYAEVKRLYQAGQKIASIKHLRMTGLLNGDKTLGSLGLKEAKDFVEGHNFN